MGFCAQALRQSFGSCCPDACDLGATFCPPLYPAEGSGHAEGRANRQELREAAQGSAKNPDSPKPGPGSARWSCRGCSLLAQLLSSWPLGAEPLDVPFLSLHSPPATGFQLNPAQVSSCQAASRVTLGGSQPAESGNASEKGKGWGWKQR